MSKSQQHKRAPFPILQAPLGVGRMGGVLFFEEKENAHTPFAGGRIPQEDGGNRGAQNKFRTA